MLHSVSVYLNECQKFSQLITIHVSGIASSKILNWSLYSYYSLNTIQCLICEIIYTVQVLSCISNILQISFYSCFHFNSLSFFLETNAMSCKFCKSVPTLSLLYKYQYSKVTCIYLHSTYYKPMMKTHITMTRLCGPRLHFGTFIGKPFAEYGNESSPIEQIVPDDKRRQQITSISNQSLSLMLKNILYDTAQSSILSQHPLRLIFFLYQNLRCSVEDHFLTTYYSGTVYKLHNGKIFQNSVISEPLLPFFELFQ